MSMRRADIPPGTLDLLILRTLEKGDELSHFQHVFGAVLRVLEA